MSTRELSPDQLRFICDPRRFSFATTEELEAEETIIGQPRAVRAIEFGLDMADAGFNIFVLGPAGTGRMTTIQRFLEYRAANEPVPDDWCYVYNFGDPSSPIALRMPAGRGRRLKEDMERLIERLQREIPQVLESEQYEEARRQIEAEKDRAQNQELVAFQQQVQQRGWGLVQTPSGFNLVPVSQGKPMSSEEIAGLSEEERQELERTREELEALFDEATRHAREIERAAAERIEALTRQVIANLCKPYFDELQHRYHDIPEVCAYLEDVQEGILTHFELFVPSGEESQDSPASEQPIQPFNRYRINVLIDHSRSKGAPVVVEEVPTRRNLTGYAEYRPVFGSLLTDFTMLRPGALHRANGGYLVLDAEDLLREAGAWDALRRSLQAREVRMEGLIGDPGTPMVATLRPQPIPLRVKVILMGGVESYSLLYTHDEAFQELFKVRADFATDMPNTEENVQAYARFVALRSREDRLLPFDPTGVAKVVEYGVRLAGDHERLSTRFRDIADLLHEASYWARRNGRAAVTGDDVRQALEETRYRSNMIEEEERRSILRGRLFIDTEGEAIGQVNGLVVTTVGSYSYGRPVRITARTFVGKGDVIAIDREVKMTGPIHDKGVLILSGYLGAQYAFDHPLSLSATITFEQTYSPVEGDSASLAELLALLSSLADLPLRQDIAVTGSVNQYGQIQPVGGVTEKVEGFFDLCVARGLTGSQGVVIPAANVSNLVLREELVDAVREGRFHIWAIDTVDDALALMMGTPAGERQADGAFPEGTVHRRVYDRLCQLARCAKREES